MNLMDTIRSNSKALHYASENTGFIKRIVDKTATTEGYAVYLYNLSLMYKAIEDCINENSDNDTIKNFITPELYRYESMEKDLKFLLQDKLSEMKPLSSTVAFIGRIEEIKDSNPELIIAHAYTRFMADLFGGRTFFELFSKEYKIPNEGLNYYSFPDIKDIRGYAFAYMNKLNMLNLSEEMQAQFINEVTNSYVYNLSLSNEVEVELCTANKK